MRLVRNGEQEVDLKNSGEFYRKTSYKTSGKLRKKTAKKALVVYSKLSKQYPDHAAYKKYIEQLIKIV